jgi:hypothetical protein
LECLAQTKAIFNGVFLDLPYLVMSQWDPALGLALSHMGVTQTTSINHELSMAHGENGFFFFFWGPL